MFRYNMFVRHRELDYQHEEPTNGETKHEPLARVDTSHLNPIDHFEILHPFEFGSAYGECVYMDYNGTTPVYPEVCQVMIPFLTTCFGNPSSSHVFAKPCRDGIVHARDNVGNLLNASAPADEIYFTSCGTESDNRAVDIALHHFATKVDKATIPHVITDAIEHPAVLNYLRQLEAKGGLSLTVLGVSKEGKVSVEAVQGALTPQTALVTVMHSNNEVGTLQPIREIVEAVRSFNEAQGANVLVHTDAAQSIGKVVVDVESLGVDLMTIVGHKFGAPKGIAALYVRKSRAIELPPLLTGGGQERGVRAGTENVPYIVALGEASRIALTEFNETFLHVVTLRLHFLHALFKTFPDKLAHIKLNGSVKANDAEEVSLLVRGVSAQVKSVSPRHGGTPHAGTLGESSNGALVTVNRPLIAEDAIDQLPNTLSISFQGIPSHEVLAALHDKVACSAGSACHATDGSVKISPVLKAMGVEDDFAEGTLRLTFGRHSSINDVNKAVGEIEKVVRAAWEAKKAQAQQH